MKLMKGNSRMSERIKMRRKRGTRAGSGIRGRSAMRRKSRMRGNSWRSGMRGIGGGAQAEEKTSRTVKK